MEELIRMLAEILAAARLKSTVCRGRAGEHYFQIGHAAFRRAISFIKERRELTLMDLWAAEDFGKSGLSLFYAFEREGSPGLLVLVVKLTGNGATSIAREYPIASYLERAVSDGFGIEFAGAFDTRRLFLHEVYPQGFHPLLKSFKNGPVKVNTEINAEDEYHFRDFEGEGVYQIPVGPVHAGIIEPGHFRFSVIGETIINLEIRHFYKHRGLEKLAEGMKPAEAVKIAETISGDESAANACAFSLAVEHLAGMEAPRRAWQLRAILLELERIYSHLGDLAGMVVDVAYPVGAAPFFVLREEILRQNATLTGSRFLKGVIVPGGLARDIEPLKLEKLHTYTEEFNPRLERALENISNSAWVIDRFETTGVVKKELIRPLHLSGPAARAAGSSGDTRSDHPYGPYPTPGSRPRTKEPGDVLARFQLKAEEIRDSIGIIQSIISLTRRGEVLAPVDSQEGFALSLIEAPRGQNLHWVYLKKGRVERYHIRTASFCNWLAIEHAVIGNIVPDFPLINKSLNFSYAGNDL